MKPFELAVYRSTLNPQEINDFLLYVNFINENMMSDKDKETLKHSPFQFGDEVCLSYEDKIPEIGSHTVDVINYDGECFTYMISLDKGGEHMYGWLDEYELEKI